MTIDSIWMYDCYIWWMIWIAMTYESVIVIHNEWHEFVMTIESIWDCIDDWKMLIDIYMIRCGIDMTVKSVIDIQVEWYDIAMMIENVDDTWEWFMNKNEQNK